jgi:Tol biopolymer transport system component
MPGGARAQLTFFRDEVNTAQYPPKGGDSFVLSKDVGGDEFYQYYRYDLDSGDITLLTDGKSRNTGAVWANAGDRLAYGSTRRNGKDVDLWVVEAANPKSDRVLAELQGGGWQALDCRPGIARSCFSRTSRLMRPISGSLTLRRARRRLLLPRAAT